MRKSGVTSVAIVVALSLAVTVSSAAQQTAPTGPPRDLDNFVQRVMDEFEVPGLALAIVRDGQVIVGKGYGLRHMGESGRVDENTLFGIASNTKAFTATALGLLVEDGIIGWDDPVIDYLPWFRMSDPYVTHEITIRDLLVHRSGLALGAGDLMWWPPSDYNRREIAERLRYLPLETSFRSAYAYDNVLYSVAGEVIEEVSGMTWEEFVSSRIIDRVGMDGSNVLNSAAGNGGNVAGTHARIDGTVRPVSPLASDNTNPAGGINSNAADMAKWLIVQLDSGRVADGSQLFMPATTTQLWNPVTPIPIGPPPVELASQRPNFRFYALGFGISDYLGRRMISHTGGLPGYVSQLAMIPDIKLGIVILTNQESGAAFRSILYHLLDHYLEGPDTDWLEAYSSLMARINAATQAANDNTAAERDSESRPSLPLASYAQTYNDSWYGDIVVAMEGEDMVLRFSHTPQLVGTMEHWQHDTFIVRWWNRELRADAFVTFSLNPDGSIEDARMRAVSPATDFSFDFHHLLLRPEN
jgi:CubicO group peptidase (beta-lactamase class C family)